MKLRTFAAIVSLVALSATWMAPQAEAVPLGKPFIKGQTPSTLAPLIEKSLVQDPSGRTRIDGGYATPEDFLLMFRIDDPNGAPKTLAELASYLRNSLESRPIPDDLRYWSSCEKPTDDRAHHPSGWYPVHNCVARTHHKGEVGWYDRKTGRLVLMGDCSNPAGLPENEQPCVYLMVPHAIGKAGDIRLKQYGPTDIAQDVCTGVKRAGESDYESPFVDKCPQVGCTFDAVDRKLGSPGWEIGSYEYDARGGWDIYRFPAKVARQHSGYVVVFCMTVYQSVGGRNDSRSCAVGVRWFDYLPQNDGTKLATIYYSEQDAKRVHAHTITKKPADIYWQFNNKDCFVENSPLELALKRDE